MNKPIKNAKVVVVGGRNFQSRKYVYYVLDAYHKKHNIRWIYSGGARGVDTWAIEWAHDRTIFGYTIYLAQWKRSDGSYDGGAGYKRNIFIAQECDVMLAFPDPNSKGTWHSINKAKEFNKPVFIFELDKDD